jgi:hypothetical protein
MNIRQEGGYARSLQEETREKADITTMQVP